MRPMESGVQAPFPRDPAEESRSQERSEKAASHLRFLEPNRPPAIRAPLRVCEGEPSPAVALMQP